MARHQLSTYEPGFQIRQLLPCFLVARPSDTEPASSSDVQRSILVMPATKLERYFGHPTDKRRGASSLVIRPRVANTKDTTMFSSLTELAALVENITSVDGRTTSERRTLIGSKNCRIYMKIGPDNDHIYMRIGPDNDHIYGPNNDHIYFLNRSL